MVAGVLVLALVAGLVVLGTSLLRRATRTTLEQALAVVPESSLRVGFTDWAQVRAELGSDLGDTPSRDEVQAMIDRAYETDLGAVSGVDESAGALQELFGFGPGTADWEAFAQGREGAAMVLKTPDGTDFGVLGDNLRRAGYDAPAGGDDEGTWVGGIDLVSQLDPTLNPEVQFVALLPDQGLVVSSDVEEYATSSARVARGDAPAASDKAGVDDLAERLKETPVALLWTGDFACEDLSMARADEDAQTEAESLVADAGGVNPLAGFAMGLDTGRTLHVVAHLADEAQAREDLRPRATLAVGPALGRGEGSFADDFELTRSRAVGSDVLLDLRPRTDDGFVMSALYDGPLLFATC